MLWFDHDAIWYIMNHLGDFFETSSLQGKMTSVLVFLSITAHATVKEHISFMFAREMETEAAVELCTSPNKQLLPYY